MKRRLGVSADRRRTGRRRKCLWLLPVLLAACFLPAAAEARQVTQDQPLEEIVSYDVTIRVEADGWMEVTEEIRVRALGDRIRRTIYRDFSATFPPGGPPGRVKPPFELVRARRDGSPEPWVLMRRGGPGVRIGDPSGLYFPGEHTYSLTYRTSRWIDIEDDRARLRWSVVGMGWSFPIRSASVRVRLPDRDDRVGKVDVTMAGWTGPAGPGDGSVLTGLEPDADSGSVAVFRTVRPMPPGEDMTVRLTFPAEVVSALLPPKQAPWVRLAWRPYTDTAVVVLFLLAFFLLVWAVDGRDPPARPVTVQYEPPDGLSPAAVGYLDHRGYDQRHMTAVLMSLARQGVLEIEERDDRKWTVRRIGPMPPDITPDERSVLDKLLPDPDALVILGISHRRIWRARRALRKELKRRFQTRFFVTNRHWSVLGFVLSLVGFAGLAWQSRSVVPPHVWGLVVGLLVATMVTGRLLTRGYRAWRIDLAEMSPRPSLLAASVFPVLSLVPLAVLGVLARDLYQAISPHLLVAILALSAINAVFFEILERPTPAGQEMLDHVEGFKRFLTATEEDRVRRLSSEESQDLFDRLLPYAVALGMENRWAALFGSAMSPVIPDG